MAAYLVTKAIVKKRGNAKTCTRLRQIRNAIGNTVDVDNLEKNIIIVDYSVNGATKCSSGIVFPHKDGKGKLGVSADVGGNSGILMEVGGKLMFEVE